MKKGRFPLVKRAAALKLKIKSVIVTLNVSRDKVVTNCSRIYLYQMSEQMAKYTGRIINYRSLADSNKGNSNNKLNNSLFVSLQQMGNIFGLNNFPTIYVSNSIYSYCYGKYIQNRVKRLGKVCSFVVNARKLKRITNRQTI